MTKELLERLPKNVADHIEVLRTTYINNKCANNRDKSEEYVKGLMDAELITDRERQILFVYTTIDRF